ncbi:uncharacterized protein [Drosophila takahashii]|uniref:uncharacterized protein n=1 Tax=Drosophila takahashii TaxID=29030 RepID=UPI0038995E55
MKFYNDCRESYDKYRAIIRDGMEQSTSQAEGLGIGVSSWDTILIAIIKQKLDLASRALYEQSLDGSRELQGLDTLLSFLDQRIRVLGTGKKGQQSRKEQRGPTSSSATTGKGPCCQFCKRNHWLYKCDDFRSKTIPERVNWVQKQRLCVNCFSNDHKAKDCRGRPCFKRDKKHHTLLHLETTSGASPNQHSPTLPKWCSNNGQILKDIPEVDTIKTVKLDETLTHYSLKTLGLVWMPKRDQLCGRSQKSEVSIITKRGYADDMAKVINEVKSKEDVLMMLLKNQTSILDSTINVVRKSKSSTDNRIRNLEHQIATINKERGNKAPWELLLY